ncbi:MAG TPA: WD40 repeat domain-containing protein [Herpetosiphonaceae bacterium]|nr:WD40 repeat domain-containing protein [Herpetosiphonaceae bacterium]
MARVQIVEDGLEAGRHAILIWTAWVVGACLGWLLAGLLIRLAGPGVLAVPWLVGIAGVAAIFAGATAGAMQAGLLRRWLLDTRSWIATSAAGAALAAASVIAGPAVVAWAEELNPRPDLLLAAALLELGAGGLVVAFAILLVAGSQWLILRRSLRPSDWRSRLALLIGAAGGAFVLGSLLGLALATARGGATTQSLRDVAPWIGLWLFGLLAASIFLAAALAALLHQADAWSSTAGMSTQPLVLPATPTAVPPITTAARPPMPRRATFVLVTLYLCLIPVMYFVPGSVLYRWIVCSTLDRMVGLSDCRTSLRGHSEVIESVQFAPDGRTLASTDHNGQVQVWNVADGSLVRTLAGYRVAYAPDGRVLATADNRQIHLWQAADGAKLATLSGHGSWVMGLAFSPDGTLLASASRDKTVRVWRVEDGKLLHTMPGHTAYVYTVAWAPDGRLLASSSYDGTVRLWRMPSGELARTITTSGAIVHGVAFSPDGSRLVSAQHDGTLRVWRTGDGTQERSILAYETDLDMLSARFAPDGTRIIAAAEDGRVGLWSVDGKRLATIRVPGGDAWAFDISPDGHTLATGSADHNVRLWDIGAE